MPKVSRWHPRVSSFLFPMNLICSDVVTYIKNRTGIDKRNLYGSCRFYIWFQDYYRLGWVGVKECPARLDSSHELEIWRKNTLKCVKHRPSPFFLMDTYFCSYLKNTWWVMKGGGFSPWKPLNSYFLRVYLILYELSSWQFFFKF